MVLRTCHYPPDCWPWHTWPAGRLFLLPVCRTPGGETVNVLEPGAQRRLVTEALSHGPHNVPELQDLSNRDVLAVQLFACDVRDNYPPERLPDYEETLALVREIGPGLRGVMVGNHLGPELYFRKHEGMAEFVKAIGGLLRDMRVTPFFAAMTYAVINDAYRRNRVLLRALKSVGAINYVACGYTIVPGAYSKPGLTGGPMKLQRQLAHRNPAAGLMLLRDYLRAGNFWSGLCGDVGIRAGNVQKLTAHGYRGFSTKIEPSEIEGLQQDFGDWWADGWDLPLLRLRVSGSYTYQEHTYIQGESFLPRSGRERTYLLSIGGSHPIFEEVRP